MASAPPPELAPNGGRRLWVGLAGALALLAAFQWHEAQRSPFTEIAGALQGEHWYRIQLEGAHVGYMYNLARRDAEGRWQFISTTHFLLQDQAPNTITKRLTFGSRAPHVLHQADYENRRHDTVQATRVTRTASGYSAEIQRGTQINQLDLDWHYTLADFLGFEYWLHSTTPGNQAERLVRDLDFERLKVTQRAYQVVEQNQTGYLVQTSAPFAATTAQLDQHYRPRSLQMAGMFQISESSEARATAIKEMRRKTSYLFPLDRRINDHARLRSLRLKVHNASPGALPTDLVLGMQAVTRREARHEHRGEELRFPLTDNRIQSLAQRALARRPNGGDLLDALLLAAHEQLEYAEGDPAGSVPAALDTRRGECTDFADLLTTLARAVGLPARTVYGLAYKDGASPAFMFHAWNEVYVNDRWQTADPTWNQRPADPTHIALSDGQAAALMLDHNTRSVSFELVSAAYF